MSGAGAIYPPSRECLSRLGWVVVMNESDLRTSVDGAVFVPDAAGFDAERPGLNRAVPHQPAVIVGAQQIRPRLATP